MKTYLLNLSHKCNVNCVFCEIPMDLKKSSHKSISVDNLKGLKENSKKFDELRLTGGDPTIYPQLFEILEYVKKECYFKKVRIESNGLMFYYKDFVKKLVEHGIDHFQISFLTTDKEAYDKIIGVKNSYEYVLKGIENIKSFKKSFGTNTVVHKYNYKLLPEIVKTLVDIGSISIQLSSFNPATPFIKNGKAVASISYKESLPYLKKAIEMAKQLEFKYIHIVNYPFCVVKDILDVMPGLIEDNKEISMPSNIAKEKTEECKKCNYYSSCEGIWKAYLKEFGDREFEPIEKQIILEN